MLYFLDFYDTPVHELFLNTIFERLFLNFWVCALSRKFSANVEGVYHDNFFSLFGKIFRMCFLWALIFFKGNRSASASWHHKKKKTLVFYFVLFLPVIPLMILSINEKGNVELRDRFLKSDFHTSSIFVLLPNDSAF